MPKTFVQLWAESRGLTEAEVEYLGVPLPRDLEAIYSAGYQGIGPIERKYGGAQRSLYEAIPWVRGLGKGKANLAYLAPMALDKEFGGWEAQTQGTCTSHALRNAGTCDYCMDALMGETEYKGRLCTENLYAARGFRGEGSSPSTLARYVSKNGPGGFITRQKYDSVDLSTFSSQTERWAASRGGKGNPPDIDAIASQNKALEVLAIDGVEMERDAHALGFGTFCGCNYGFSDVSDQNGVMKRKGSWNHAMAGTATNDTKWAWDTYGVMLSGIQQSWGRWGRLNGWPQGVPPNIRPAGHFWVSGKDRDGMIKSGEAFIIADVQGINRKSWDYLETRAIQLAEMSKRLIDEQMYLSV